MAATNSSEAFVHALCRRSFLSLWSIENPIAPNGKELCDALVVVGDHVLVLSIKDCTIADTDNPVLDAERWHRKAIEKSIKQVGGAVRMLPRMADVARRDNLEVRIPLPGPESRKLHLLAVAFGSKGRVDIGSGDHGFGFVHILVESDLQVLMGELDTVTDFVSYLSAKEAFMQRASAVLLGGEKDMLALYLRDGRTFPSEVGHIVYDDGIWEVQQRERPEVQRRKVADKVSYAWDSLIEEFAGHVRGGSIEGNAPEGEAERGLRYMALENRFHRRVLGDAFVGFLRRAQANEAMTRTSPSPSGVIYIFLAAPRHIDPWVRGGLLNFYVALLRERNPSVPAVVGIVTEIPDGQGHSFGLVMMDGPVDERVRGLAAEAREMGLLRSQRPHEVHHEEFPGNDE